MDSKEDEEVSFIDCTAVLHLVCIIAFSCLLLFVVIPMCDIFCYSILVYILYISIYILGGKLGQHSHWMLVCVRSILGQDVH